MTEDQIVISIAKLEGWTSIERCNKACASYAGIPPEGSIYGKYRQHLPNYSEDLNAIHVVEEALTEEQFETYAFWLAHVSPLGKQLVATAAQRAEALLKALNLWEDEA